ncbi:MAG: hypothetical protein K9I70_01385 [Chitinophagaceae bacterium]|nr:hypothetical protein [Chitinophagaceae bacterium]
MFYMFAKLNLYMIGCYGAATGIAAEIKSASFDITRGCHTGVKEGDLLQHKARPEGGATAD